MKHEKPKPQHARHSFHQEDGFILLIANAPRMESYRDVWGKTHKMREHKGIKKLAEKAACVIAVDGGANIAHHYDIAVDYLIGDHDSIMSFVLEKHHNDETKIIFANPNKNETDLELALEFIDSREELRSKPLRIANVLGGRIDHELAALGTIARFSHLQPLIDDNELRVFFLNTANPELEIVLRRPEIDPPFSVIPINGEAVVSETGVKWELDHARLRPLDPRGVSNHVKRDAEHGTHITVHEGVVAVIINTF